MGAPPMTRQRNWAALPWQWQTGVSGGNAQDSLTRTEPATTSATNGKLEIVWENVAAPVPFTVK
jgi:hypothetical protein